MKRFLNAHVSALLLVLVAVAAAPADQATLPLDWTYSFTPLVPGTQNLLSAVFADPKPGGGSAGVTFTRTSTDSPLPHSKSRNTDVVATNLTVFSSAPLNDPNSLT